MNLMNRFITKNEKLQLNYTNPDLPGKMNERIMSWLPAAPKEYVIVCVGTDRSTGDALGPLTGSFLSELKPKHLHIYGTLPEPVHATNMPDYIKHIYKRHQDAFLIAVDASLGKAASVGSIIVDTGSLSPGAALNKNLPAIGDIHITGVVNISGFMEFTTLQNTRLSLVVDMAKHIAALLDKVDQQLTNSTPFPAIVAPENQTLEGEM
ncbi:spore protease YyaC [Lentibacillus salicampi]|uniref:Spore protease YyaC n=1 Tax=Lentibacillus salicampi TaxID=175306 RepID=A0A4Y9A913_9BACI|nr:spore protease YyaC [Lentibacillus salicampi]TFJ92283.1 spore protease YyaC [Lentibacillus salicampi]